MKKLKIVILTLCLIFPFLLEAQVMPISFFQNRATNIADNGSANALDFDGINDYVITTLNADVSVMPVTTWEAWVYPTKNNGDWQMIVGIEDTGWDRFIAINNGAFHMGYGGGGWQAVAADMNQWQHIAVVYNEAAGFIKFYKNGVAYSFTPGPFSHTSNVKFSIGCSQQGSPGQFYQGRIDDVRVWTVERTQAQIQANMNIELLGTETGLKAYYTFNQGIAGGNNAAITTVTDKTANALNGALTNFTKTGSTSNFIVGKVSSTLVTNSLVLNLDASNSASYPGTGTTWLDLSGNGVNATLVNGVSYSSANGGSLVFDGSNDFVRVGPVSNTGTSTVSVSFGLWVNPSSTSGNIMSMSNSNPQGGWNMPPIAASSQRFRGKIWSNNLLLSTSNYILNNWYYLVLVYDYPSRTQKFYVNGVLQDSQSGVDYDASGVDNYIFLGQSNPGADNTGMFSGRISSLQIYGGKALSDIEVLQNFNSSKSKYGL